MAELLDEAGSLESTTVGVFRTAATIKGGRRFSFSALVVVGDRRGNVGVGYAKAKEVPPAIEKAQKDARKNMRRLPLQGGTLPHAVEGRFGASSVRLIPASPGTGVVAGGSVRAILEMAGVTDCLTKCFGSTNKQNVVKAAMQGLSQLAQKDQIASLRGVEIEKTKVDGFTERAAALGAGRSNVQKAKGPTNTVGQESRGRGRGGRGGQQGGGRRRRPAGGGESGGAPGSGGEPEGGGGEAQAT